MKTEFEPVKFIGLVLTVVVSALVCLMVLGLLAHVVVGMILYGWHVVDALCK